MLYMLSAKPKERRRATTAWNTAKSQQPLRRMCLASRSKFTKMDRACRLCEVLATECFFNVWPEVTPLPKPQPEEVLGLAALTLIFP